MTKSTLLSLDVAKSATIDASRIDDGAPEDVLIKGRLTS
jgi:hypothetical protein